MNKNKELLKNKLYQSDILNIETQYYKIEKIKPITPKPTETNRDITEFVPNYKINMPYLKLSNNLFDNYQSKSISLNNLNFSLKRQNSEVQILRKYNKTIRDNCFDEKGNFSAKKRFRFEFYGKEGDYNIINNQSYTKMKKKRSIKKRRKIGLRNMDKGQLDKFDNVNNIGHQYYKRSCNCRSNHNDEINNDDEYLYKKEMEYTPHEQIKKEIINQNTLSNLEKKPIKLKSNNFTFSNLDVKHNDEIHLTKYSSNIKTIKNKSNNKYYKNKNEQSESDDFYIEIKNENKSIKDNNIFIDQKRLKQIFLKNGIHIYNFNEDGINTFSGEGKIEAKLRRNKNDENFDKRYENVVRELYKINVKVNRRGLVFENCIYNKNSKIRKGTPGKILKQRKKKNYEIKRDKYVQPITNHEYKNGYKYNLNYFNHKRYN